jgi:hypothetical protein
MYEWRYLDQERKRCGREVKNLVPDASVLRGLLAARRPPTDLQMPNKQ